MGRAYIRDLIAIAAYQHMTYKNSGGMIHNFWGFGNNMVAYLFSPYRRIMTGETRKGDIHV